MRRENWEQRKRKLQERAEQMLQAADKSYNSEDFPAGISELIHDLTVQQVELEIQNDELQKAQFELAQANERLMNLYHFAPIGFLLIESHGMVIQANKTFADQVGTPYQEMAGKPFVTFVYAEDKSIFHGRFSTFFKSPEGKHIDVRIAQAKGAFFYARIVGCTQMGKLFNHNAAPDDEMLLVAIHDITEQQKVQLELQITLMTMQQQIDSGIDLCRSKDSIIAEQNRRHSLFKLLVNIAHQWRQPLNVCGIMIQEIGEMIRQNDIDTDLALEYTTDAMDQLISLSNTISVLTNMYDSQSAPKLYFIKQLITTALSYITNDRLQVIEIDMQIPDELTIYAIESDMVEVFLELIGNVINITQSRKLDSVRCTITARALTPERIQLIFDDTAGGIDPAVLPYLFDPYSTTAFKGQGKGLGLYHLRHIIENRYRGSIEAESSKSGARFIITIGKLAIDEASTTKVC
ncbi:PAS domain-containing sensor histidine kinase [Chrysiogenes arsenatis]|uniref:PAS domain-containing sensor histidine kinase n=1 Tax=Chrysiogenes arsenatis TaxID=309797 RepID=UPI0004105AB3|nr:PAS domain-containing sensor histidine kinase [Chrysiogenes arsenatis]